MKISQKVPVLFACFFAIVCYAQSTQHEFGFRTDNDLYVSTTLDKYYTNGLDLYYRSTAKKSFGPFTKRIRSITAGHKMYNPHYFDIVYTELQDRPYAGYVYANYSESVVNKKHMISIGAEFGFTGEKTKAREAQAFVHQFYDKTDSDGWDTQIKEKFALGVSASYVGNLYYNPEKNIQLSFISNALLHQIFTNVSSGLGIKFNLDKNNPLNSIDNTSFYGTAIHTENEHWTKECFLGIKSYVTYQKEDHTVTGELGNNFANKEFNIEPWVWHNDLGLYWSLKHWNISYHQIFHTANVKNLNTHWIRYGSIQLSYKF